MGQWTSSYSLHSRSVGFPWCLALIFPAEECELTAQARAELVTTLPSVPWGSVPWSSFPALPLATEPDPQLVLAHSAASTVLRVWGWRDLCCKDTTSPLCLRWLSCLIYFHPQIEEGTSNYVCLSCSFPMSLTYTEPAPSNWGLKSRKQIETHYNDLKKSKMPLECFSWTQWLPAKCWDWLASN